MTGYDFVDVSDDYFDVVAGVKFEELLAPSNLSHVLQIILTVAQSNAAKGSFFVGFTAIDISLEVIQLGFRFSRRKDDILKLSLEERDELPRKIVRFTWHLLAKIDERYPLRTDVFPDSFRSYINLDE